MAYKFDCLGARQRYVVLNNVWLRFFHHSSISMMSVFIGLLNSRVDGLLDDLVAAAIILRTTATCCPNY